jgi:hypothetical protein
MARDPWTRRQVEEFAGRAVISLLVVADIGFTLYGVCYLFWHPEQQTYFVGGMEKPTLLAIACWISTIVAIFFVAAWGIFEGLPKLGALICQIPVVWGRIEDWYRRLRQ